jgi:lysophospholipase L1-like esterase
VVFLGDSWTEGIGATGLRGYAVLTPEQLTWNYQVLGVGGSGYLATGRGSVFEQRIEEAVHNHPDVIVVQGSLNDRIGTSSALQSAALHMLSRLRAAADRKTRILVLGASYTPTWGPSTIDPINAAVSDAASQVGLRFVDPAREDWTDPENATIWADGNHPNDAGHQLVADHLETILSELVRR